MTPAELVEMLATYSRIITASPQDRERGRSRATAALAELFPGADHDRRADAVALLAG